VSTNNPLRGEVALTGDSGKTYTIRLGTNALARMQEAFNEPTLNSLLARLMKGGGGDFSLIDLRKMVQASVVGDDISELDAGDLIDDCGMKATVEGFTASLQSSLRGGSNGNGANPRKGSAKKKRDSADSLSTPQT
jgi:hypothetical protein